MRRPSRDAVHVFSMRSLRRILYIRKEISLRKILTPNARRATLAVVEEESRAKESIPNGGGIPRNVMAGEAPMAATAARSPRNGVPGLAIVFQPSALSAHMRGLCAVTRRRLHKAALRRDRQGISFDRRRIDEIGSVALLFASDAASLLAGSIVSADGDYSCR